MRIALLSFVLAFLVASGAARPEDESAAAEEKLEGPRRTSFVNPKYPPEADRAGLAGKVVLAYVIDEKGRVRDIQVRLGAPPLTDAVADALKKWRYEPARRDGVPIPAAMSLTINFKLRELHYDGLMRSLDHDSELLRETAAGHLGGLRATRNSVTEKQIRKAVEALEVLVAEDKSPRVRTAAARALTRLDGRPLPEGMHAVDLPKLRRVAWGSFIDPAGLSEAREIENGVEIVVPPGFYDLSVERGITTAPRLLRRVEGDFVVEVEVGKVSSAVGLLHAPEQQGYHGAGLLLWQNEESYVRLESATYGGSSGPRYALFERRAGGLLVGGLDPALFRIDDEPTSFRLERRGSELRAFARQGDGEWREVGHKDADLPTVALVGVAAVNTAGSELAVTFRQFRLSQPDGS